MYKGVNYVADIYQSYADANSLSSLSPDGINAVALTPDFGIDANNNTVYDNDVTGGFTESDSDIATTISDAEAAGQSVMVRPLIDFLPSDYYGDSNTLNDSYYNDEFRNNYNPGAALSAGANSFFASYQAMIVQEAKVAQAGGAAIFDIGVELDQITGPSYESYWTSIINAIKAPVSQGGAGYTGKLTYSALFDDSQSYWQYQGTGLSPGTGDITTQISFWSQLDYVGIDEYAAITDNPNPTVQDLINAWTEPYNTVPDADPTTEAVVGTDSLIQYYENISATLGKPLLFTELGYGNTSDAASSPATPGYDESGNTDNAVTDPNLQANLYTAFFDAWQQAGNSSLAGVYLWSWEPNGGSNPDQAGDAVLDQYGGDNYTSFTVQGLPAETAVKNGFDTTLCYLRGTAIRTPSGDVPVESLRIGDLVITRFGGVQPIKWIGRQCYDIRFLRHNRDKIPVTIAAEALGCGLPVHDLLVSPGHSVLLGDTLVLARDLINGVSICQDFGTTQPDQVVADYYQIELAAHDCVLAEGAWAETYADAPGLRAQFHNVREFYELYPDYQTPKRLSLCAPRPETGPAKDAALRPIITRATAHLPPGRLEGYVDRAAGPVLTGWAMDVDYPYMPVLLEILRDRVVIGSVLACDFRQDLQQAGKAAGRCAFTFSTPPGPAIYTVRRAADGAGLPLNTQPSRLAA
jgi:hypothetical protein